ncbi:hypothetical protein [uncultured Chryseobacterium sp.]|jgi:hypothetical protein|uniref:hypothetical protein n=1 Tax=uncultured Chryseobacterium sp. TaxID=259322 RepID=UPI00258842AB|nr:hypothetical protein [uncultured Chryseobacterium sp.]
MKNTYQLLHTLYRKDLKQLIEWSVEFNRDNLTHRYKPTMYLYPDEQKEIFRALNNLMRSLGTPETLLKVQKKSMLRSVYQGIRIPESEEDHKCLYLHEEGHSHIHSYRWKDDMNFDRCFYRFGLNDIVEQNSKFIHPDLKEFYEALKKGKEYNRLFGNWIQEDEECVREIYLSFPSKPTLKWILDSFYPLLTDEVYFQLVQYEDLPIKNIGFDTFKEKNPKVTLYFSVSPADYFPADHTELVRLTNASSYKKV